MFRIDLDVGTGFRSVEGASAKRIALVGFIDLIRRGRFVHRLAAIMNAVRDVIPRGKLVVSDIDV